MFLTISLFMFWDDPKTFSESILSSLIFLARNRIPGLPIAVLKNHRKKYLKNLSHLCLEIVVLLPRDIILTFFYWRSSNELLQV